MQELLERLAAACRKRPALWSRYLEEVFAHQQSKAVDLRALGREVKFIAACGDVGQLTPALELAWHVAQVEAGNHDGALETSSEARIEQLSAQLVDEEPALVCQADLLRAVRQTNAFAFDEAERRQVRWKDARPREPGLRHFGQLLSQRGQHEAFRGRPASALPLFHRAPEAIERLSDPATRRAEQGHTVTYLAIATMDLPGASPEDIRRRVLAVVSLKLGEITRLAADASPGRKYAHHLLLRYLVSHGTAAEREAYLAARDDWKADVGHPWQRILAYRAALRWPMKPATGKRLMDREVELTPTEEETVKKIGAVIAKESRAWSAGARTLERMAEKLPFNFR